MSMLRNDVLLHFCPAIGMIAELARLDGVGFSANYGGNSHGYRKSLSPGGTVSFEWTTGNVQKSDLRWQEFAMLYLGNIRSQQAWEILHMDDVVVKNHL